MRASLTRRLSTAVVLAFFAGLLASGYILLKFYGYEDTASRVMSGDQRTVIQGRLIEARVNGALELAQGSANSEEADHAFRDRLVSISDDLKASLRERADRNLEDARRQLSAIVSTKAEPIEDLFVQYRNIKTTAFNLYRMAWSNKWMGVAHGVGLIVNDLDNLPYHAAERAAAGITSKITTLIEQLATSPMPQQAKLIVLAQLNTLKSQLIHYGDSVKQAETVRTERVDELKALAATMRKYNESQGRSMLEFGNEARAELFKALIAFLVFVLFVMGWWAIAVGRFRGHVDRVATHLVAQFESWVAASGNVASTGLEMPAKPDAELIVAYKAMDNAIRRMNGIRKEDILVKRLLNVPFLLVNKNRQAIFWNSALSILGKVRALEETGPVSYANLARFTSAQGKVLDPIDKALAENKEITQLALMRVGEDSLAVQATCTPVQGADHQPEYVMVHIRDLREENRRAESELDRQLECVRAAIESVRVGKVPPDPGGSLRRPVLDAMAAIKSHALELGERNGVMAGQVETMRGRMSREAGLKRTVHGRMEQVREQTGAVRGRLEGLCAAAERAVARVSGVNERGNALAAGYNDLRRRAGELSRDLGRGQSLVVACQQTLGQTEQLAAKVRASERVIRELFEKSAVLNANNSILGSKRELTPTDVVTITENITQMMNQFDRSYRLIRQSVDEVERGLATLSSKLKERLANCEELASRDYDIVKVVTESEKLIDATARETSDFVGEISALESENQRLGAEIRAVEGKVQALCQIGQASVELQNQLELGFEGMLGSASTPIGGHSGEAASGSA